MSEARLADLTYAELIKRIAIMRGMLTEEDLGAGHPAAASDSGHVRAAGGEENKR